MLKLAVALLALSAAPAARAQTSALGPRVDAAVTRILRAEDTPAASVAVVQGGRIVYAKAYGLADVARHVPATTATRFQIASVSKEFTAAAALILQQDGKLSLDDRVSKWLPELTDADKVTVRQLLTHTSGYSDFWPQDYVPARFTRPTTPDEILAEWGRRPLDFAPGTDWQYSNTGYVIAGRIIEKASGRPLFDVLKARIFRPLGMSVGDLDAGLDATAPDAKGYQRAALGPLRPAPPLGANWLYAAGEMATTASDVAKWDVSLMDRALLTRASYDQELATAKLADGKDTGYALGLFVKDAGGRREWEHSGEGAGFLAENRMFPDDRVAVVVLVNSFSTSAEDDIADAITDMVLTPKGAEAQARRVFASVQAGRPLRAEMTPECAAYFDAQATADYASSLGPLGAPVSFTRTGHSLRGGMEIDTYRVKTATRSLRLSVFVNKAGRIDQFLVYDAT